MALTKTIEIDKIEIVSEYRHIHIRTATIIKEDGVELNRSFNRKVLQCGELDSGNNLVDTKVNTETAEIQAICNAVWTISVKNAWKAFLLSKQTLPGS